jgi:hypothetical protein
MTMARTLVSIVGGQTQPNILLAKELHQKVGPLDRMVLIHSKSTKVQADRIRLACAEIESEVLYVEVIENDIIDIEQKLTQEVILEDEDDIHVNITGGTKTMAIGVYNFFVKYSARILYVNLGRNNYDQLFPRVRNKTQDFRYALDLQEYFMGYGVRIGNPSSLHKRTKTGEDTQAFFEKARDFRQAEWETIDLLRQGYAGKGYRGRAVRRHEGQDDMEKALRERIFRFLDDIGFRPDQPGVLSKAETKYLTGDWFEEYVYGRLAGILDLRPTQWGMGLQIGIENGDDDSVSNELDLAVMLRNDLHLIECKTRLVTTDGSNIITDTLYKLDSLRTKFGLNVRASLFTLAEESEFEKGIPRGKLNSIAIVNLNQLQDPQALAAMFRR